MNDVYSLNELMPLIESGAVHVRCTCDYRIDEYDGSGGNALPVYNDARKRRVEGHCERVQVDEVKETPLLKVGVPSERAGAEYSYVPAQDANFQNFEEEDKIDRE